MPGWEGREGRFDALRRAVLGAAIVALGALALIGGITPTAQAAPPAPGFEIVTQPDGTRIALRQWGNAFSNGYETIDGYTVVPDKQGVWRYAEIRDGRLVAGPYAVGSLRPASLEPHLRSVASDKREPARALHTARGDVAKPTSSHAPAATPTLVILAAFTDRAPVDVAADWSSLLFTGANSAAAYFADVSGGAKTLTPASETDGAPDDGVVGWLTLPMPHPRDTALNPGFGRAKTAVAAALAAADASVDFAAFDTDASGALTADELHVVVVMAGFEAAFSRSCGASIWGHQWWFDAADGPPLLDGITVSASENGGYVVIGEQHCRSGAGSGQATVGIVVHELGHDLGLPDLYDTDGSSAGVDTWSLMGTGTWLSDPPSSSGVPGVAGNRPGFPDPWSRWHQGWVEPRRVVDTETITLSPTASGGEVLLLGDNPAGVDWVRDGRSGVGEYFLAENRQATGWDTGIAGCGLLVWHIDETRPTRTNANADENRRLVDVEQADGRGDLYGFGAADAGDPYPGITNASRFGDDTTPSSRRYSGASSGVSIDNIAGGPCGTPGDVTADFTVDRSIGGGSGYDAFGQALEVVAFPLVDVVDNTTATLEPGEPIPDCTPEFDRSVWYRIEPTTDLRVDVDTAGSDFDTVIAAYRFTGDLATLEPVACSDDVPERLEPPPPDFSSAFSFIAAAGEISYVQAGSYNGEFGTLIVEIDAVDAADVPPNDLFADAAVADTFPYLDTQVTHAANLEVGEPAPACAALGATVWYRVTPTEATEFRVSTADSDFDTVIGVWTGDTLPLLDPVTCNDDIDLIGGAVQSEVSFVAEADATYHIQIGGWAVEPLADPATGHLAVSIEALAIGPPPNDAFASAIDAAPLPFSHTVRTSAATIEPGEFSPTCNPTGRTVWYRLTPGSEQTVVLDTVGSDFDTVLAVWRGATLDDLVEVACNDDISLEDEIVQSRLTLDLEAGVSYYVQVGGWQGASGELVFRAVRRAADTVRCDVDADGFADLVIGVPGEDGGTRVDSGAVLYLPGSASGTTASGDLLITQDSPGVPGVAEEFDRFGAAVACGDFDGDGFDDLVIGAPGEAIGPRADAGAIVWIPGSQDGPRLDAARFYSQDTSGVPGVAEVGDRFGAALAAGDFDGDGDDDLAVGAPGEAIGPVADAGLVVIFEGTPSGPEPLQDLHQNRPGVPGSVEIGDGFGDSLASLDLDGDGFDDLVIGIPREDLGSKSDAGAVALVPGSASGLVPTAAANLTQSTAGVKGSAEAGDRFGAALAGGDIDGDGVDDLVVGAPGEGIGGAAGTGAIHVLYGAATEFGLLDLGMRDETWHQGSPGTPGANEAGDALGTSVAVGDFDGDGFGDVVAGVPGEALGSIVQAGQAIVWPGSAAGVDGGRAAWWHQDRPGIKGIAEVNDQFGLVVTSDDVDGDGAADLIAGSPGEGIGPKAAAGAAAVLYGEVGVGVSDRDQSWHQDRPGVKGVAEPGDRLGRALD